MPGDEVSERVSGADQIGRAVAGSHPLKCEKGHGAVALVWSDGRVEVACPICGRHDLSDRAAVREAGPPAMEGRITGGAGMPASEGGLAGDLEDTRPLPVLDETTAAAETAACAPGAAAASEEDLRAAETHGEAVVGQRRPRLGGWLLLAAFVFSLFAVLHFIRYYFTVVHPGSLSSTATVAPSAYLQPQATPQVQPGPQPPRLEIFEPTDNGELVFSPTPTSKVFSSMLAVSGRTEPGATVKLKAEWSGEIPLEVDPDGSFSYTLVLPSQPVEKITLVATNAGGNTVKTVRLNDPAALVPRNYYHPDAANLYEHFGTDWPFNNWYRPYHNTREDLAKFLKKWGLPEDYRAHAFDCSNDSAMLEWALTITGFKASIVVGPCPWDSSRGAHAWVIVYCDDGPAAVEAAAFHPGNYLAFQRIASWFTGKAPGLIYSDNPYWPNYYQGYTEEYPDIYAAARRYGQSFLQEWGWWNKTPNLPRIFE